MQTTIRFHFVTIKCPFWHYQGCLKLYPSTICHPFSVLRRDTFTLRTVLCRCGAKAVWGVLEGDPDHVWTFRAYGQCIHGPDARPPYQHSSIRSLMEELTGVTLKGTIHPVFCICVSGM